MREQHYDGDVVAGFLAEPFDSAARDRHLAGCPLCKQTLNSIRDTASLLKQPDVWNRESFSSAPRPETLAFLRNVQRTMSDEDAAAEVYVKQLLARSRDTWAGRLVAQPAWREEGGDREVRGAGERGTARTQAREGRRGGRAGPGREPVDRGTRSGGGRDEASPAPRRTPR